MQIPPYFERLQMLRWHDIRDMRFSLDPAMAESTPEALNIFQGIAAIEGKTREQVEKNHLAIGEFCDGLIAKFPQSALFWYLRGMVAAQAPNVPTARFHVARALQLDPEFPHARDSLSSLFNDDLGDDALSEFIDKSKTDSEHIIEKCHLVAKSLFDEGRLMEADPFIQLSNCLRFKSISASIPFNACKDAFEELKKQGTTKQALEDLSKKKKYDYGVCWIDDHERFIDCHKKTKEDTNKVALSELVSAVLERLSRPTACVDYGCYLGAMLNIVRENLSGHDGVSFIGIDPDPHGIDACKKEYPWVSAHLGDDGALAEIPLPDSLGVVFSNATMGIMAPEEVERVIEHFSARAEYFIIGDDIINMDGEAPLIRHGVERFLHNYGTILRKHGYTVEETVFPPLPMRYLSGFIVARKD